MKLSFDLTKSHLSSPAASPVSPPEPTHSTYSSSEITEHLITDPNVVVYTDEDLPEGLMKKPLDDDNYVWLKLSPLGHRATLYEFYIVGEGGAHICFKAAVIEYGDKKDKTLMRFRLSEDEYGALRCLTLAEVRSRYMDDLGNYDSDTLLPEQNVVVFDERLKKSNKRKTRSTLKRAREPRAVEKNPPVDAAPVDAAPKMPVEIPEEIAVSSSSSDAESSPLPQEKRNRGDTPPRKIHKADGKGDAPDKAAEAALVKKVVMKAKSFADGTEYDVLQAYRHLFLRSIEKTAVEKVYVLIHDLLIFDPNIKECEFDVEVKIRERGVNTPFNKK